MLNAANRTTRDTERISRHAPCTLREHIAQYFDGCVCAKEHDTLAECMHTHTHTQTQRCLVDGATVRSMRVYERTSYIREYIYRISRLAEIVSANAVGLQNRYMAWRGGGWRCLKSN